MRALSYAFDEALTSLWRGRRSGVLSMATIALALFVLGGFLIVVANLQRLTAEWGSGAEMSVYLADDVTADQRRALEALFVRRRGTVAAAEFVSKADALKRFKSMFGDLAGTVDTVGDNPLPASYEVRLDPRATSGGAVDSLGDELRSAAGVVDVRYDSQWLERLTSAVTILRVMGFLLAAVLTVAAALTVATVVRLALFARTDELEIMDLVGAPTAYVRGPFMMEGVLQGGMGALVALVALAMVFFGLRSRYLVPLAAALNFSAVQFLSLELALLLVVGGMAVGCVGGLVAAWGGRGGFTQS
jgi:cell division transport system permease protein